MRGKLFGTNGIRGETKTFFTSEFCFRIGATFNAFLKENGKQGTIAVAMDPRPGSQRIKTNLITGLGGDWQITDQGIIPTPCLTYYVKENNLAGGIMITGSHVEEELNGLKFFFEGEEVSKKREKEIETIFFDQFENKQFQKEALPEIKKGNQAKELYQEMLVNLAKGKLNRFRIIVDAGNGTQSEIMPSVLKKLGAEIIEQNCDLSKKLLTRDTEEQNSFPRLIEATKEIGADLAMAYDPDGDRAIFITEKGEFLPGGVSASIIALNEPGETIVTPINTSSVVNHIGKKVFRTKVGATYVAEKMKEKGVDFGFESNGGTISARFHYGRDGGITTIKMFNSLLDQDKSLSQLAATLPKYYIIKDKLDCPSELNKIILEKAKKAHQNYRIEDLDGLKIWLGEETWVLYRPSGNAPEFRVFAESRDEQEAKKLVKQGLNLIQEVIDSNQKNA